MPLYNVEQGDCISSIAFQFGLLPRTIWDHPENSALKKKRLDPNILFPGDEVFIPDKQIRFEARPTDARHKFRRLGVPTHLSVRFLHENKPRAGESYTFLIDGAVGPTGKLDADGACLISISPGSKGGKVILGDPTHGEEYPFSLGCLDPVENSPASGAGCQILGIREGHPVMPTPMI